MLGACSLLLADRRNSKARGAHEAEIDDIIGILDVRDTHGALCDVVFVAANLDVLPKFGLVELNVALLVDRQTRVEATIDAISASVQQLLASPANTAGVMEDTVALSAMQSMMTDM
jgi:hypothetical protein